ncbi:MAG: GspE/PulE family protein, partial [Opitutaceae bacterium]
MAPSEIPAGVPLEPEAVSPELVARWKDACLEHRFLPVYSQGILLQVAMPEPSDPAALAAIRRLTHQEVRSFGIDPKAFEGAINALVRETEPCPAVEEEAPVPEAAIPPAPPQTWMNPAAPTGRDIVMRLVRYAFQAGASDLLLDDQEGWLDVAIKRCGRKEILPPLDRESGPAVLRAFKEISGLSTHTASVWQTGAASVPVGDGRRADLRVEVAPTVHGESLVARVQDRERLWERMRRLPFPEEDQRREAEACLRQRQGLIVATGPTGHGKTTTLYACLGQLDRSALNIRTLEDPVEFTVPWITQIPVGAGTGRDFPGGLKSLLRQAPHVILLGELRDRAAAQTCLEAVETGHLILATLHTRDAVGVVGRLLDLGLTGRQIAAALLLSIGQRLLPRLCPECRRPAPCAPGQARHFERHGLDAPRELFVAGGCRRCGRRGVAGMIGVFEFFRPALRPE